MSIKNNTIKKIFLMMGIFLPHSIGGSVGMMMSSSISWCRVGSGALGFPANLGGKPV